jgi:hypothetical protein
MLKQNINGRRQDPARDFSEDENTKKNRLKG